MLVIYATVALVIGFIIDQIIGDPHGWPHLIIGFGKVIAGLEKVLYPMKNKRLGGTILVLCTLLICTGIPALLLHVAWHISPWLYLALESLLCWQLLAARSLQVESKKVYDELEHGTLESSRHAISMIVGRDPEALDEKGITKAAVETVAENTSDGVASPLFYMMLGGAVFGCFYKATNTMDSMIAYKNDKYMDFGRTAAHWDDIMNYIPARLCALLMILAAKLRGFDAANAMKVWKRDRRKHASPNAAQTESVMAGALDLQLAGDAQYFGRIVHKETIGDDIRPIETEDILRSHKLLQTTAVLLMLLALLVRGLFYAAI